MIRADGDACGMGARVSLSSGMQSIQEAAEIARTESGWCNCEQSCGGRGAKMHPMNTELTNANERAANAHERLGLQRVRFRTLRAGGRDTNAAAAVFRTMRRTMEASEEDRFQIEAELLMARTGPWFAQ
jgi:hypothetical protein